MTEVEQFIELAKALSTDAQQIVIWFFLYKITGTVIGYSVLITCLLLIKSVTLKIVNLVSFSGEVARRFDVDVTYKSGRERALEKLDQILQSNQKRN